MTDWVRIHITVDTGFAGATHEDEIEVDRAKWEAMTEAERDEFMEEDMQGVIADHITTSYEVVED